MSLVSKMLDAGVDTEQKLEQAIKANEQLERENALFASHLERAGIEADLDDKTELPDEALTLEQRTEIAQQEVEDIREDLGATKESYEKDMDRMKAVMEECDMRILQVKKDSFEFRRDIQIGGENPRTGKIAAEKIIRYFEEKQRSKEALIEKTKLKNSALKMQHQKMHKALDEKREMGEALLVIDFDQLKIENLQYIEKIDERTKELVQLKHTSTKTVQVLNTLKDRLNTLTTKSSTLETATREKERALASIKEEIARVRAEKQKAMRFNNSFKKKQQEIKMPQVMDYVHRRVAEDEYRKSVISWERKVEIAKRGAAEARRGWRRRHQAEMDQMGMPA